MQVSILTLFPEAFPGLLAHSVVGRALQKGLWALNVVNIRDFATDKHRTVDDTPYGGGAGMLMKPDIVASAIRAVRNVVPACAGMTGEGEQEAPYVIYLGPAGKRFTQADAKRLATLGRPLALLCGHYEGVDERVLEADVDEVISLGDFVLSGGEPAAVCMLDAVLRLIPGVLGAEGSLHEESFDITDPKTGEPLVDEMNQPLVEYPHYTRPAVWEGREVPAVLQNGNHAEIAKWRIEQARLRTKKIKGVLNTL